MIIAQAVLFASTAQLDFHLDAYNDYGSNEIFLAI